MSVDRGANEKVIMQKSDILKSVLAIIILTTNNLVFLKLHIAFLRAIKNVNIISNQAVSVAVIANEAVQEDAKKANFSICHIGKAYMKEAIVPNISLV